MSKSKKKRRWSESARKTLVLSSNYEIVNFVSEVDAIMLAFKERAEIISTWDSFVATPNRKIEIPSVLRLRHQHRRRASLVRYHRIVVFRRDEWLCQYCGRPLTRRDATIDHVIPVSQGGQTNYRNCVTACKPCNHRKAYMTPEQAQMTLRAKPEMPSVLHFYNIDTGEGWHDTWDTYIGYLRGN